jgi:hypothetical protein
MSKKKAVKQPKQDLCFLKYGMTRKELDAALKHALKICKQFKVYQAK